MRLHMFPGLKQEILLLAQDDRLPELTSYWVGEAAFSVLLHYAMVAEDDFASFAPGAQRRAKERHERLQSVLPPGDIGHIRQLSGDAQAELLPLLGAAFRPDDEEGVGRPMNKGTLIRVGGRFLIRDSDRDEWFVADSSKPHWYRCTGAPIRDLAKAIEAL